MHDNEPTIPNLRANLPDELDASPNWPLAAPQRPPLPSSQRDARTALLGVSVGANAILLLGLVGVLLLARAGYFAPPNATPAVSSSTQASNTSTAGQTPSQTPSTSTPDSSSASGWLQVTPTTVSLGCQDGQQTQFILLTNQGPEQVEWQADLGVPHDQAEVDLSPDHGQLRAEASIAVRLQNRNQDSGSSQQGVVRFEVSPADAGASPTLSYTTQGCD